MICSKKKGPAAQYYWKHFKEDEQDRDGQQLFGFALHKETTNIDETRVKTHNQNTALPSCQVYQDKARQAKIKILPRPTIQNMNTATKLTKAKIRKPTKSGEHPRRFAGKKTEGNPASK